MFYVGVSRLIFCIFSTLHVTFANIFIYLHVKIVAMVKPTEYILAETTAQKFCMKFEKAGMIAPEGIINFQDKFIYKREDVYELITQQGYSERDIYTAIVSDHLFVRNKCLLNAENDHNTLRFHLSLGQHLIIQHYMYQIQQNKINNIESSFGLLSYRWKDKCTTKITNTIIHIANRLRRDKGNISVLDRALNGTETLIQIHKQFNATWPRLIAKK